MKKWMVVGSLVGTFCAMAPAAYASDGVRGPSTPAHSRADVRSVTSEPGGATPDAHQIEIRSSIQVNHDVLREAYIASRDAYTKKLSKYAKIDTRQAQKQIAAAHPKMNVEHVQLRNVRTSLVYMGLAVDDTDRYLVIVDAGNGKVLMDRHLPSHHTRVFAGD